MNKQKFLIQKQNVGIYKQKQLNVFKYLSVLYRVFIQISIKYPSLIDFSQYTIAELFIKHRYVVQNMQISDIYEYQITSTLYIYPVTYKYKYNIKIQNLPIQRNTHMQKLSQLTQKIRKWNMMGYSLLPSLQLVIITGDNYIKQSQNILSMFKIQQIHVQNQQYNKQDNSTRQQNGTIGNKQQKEQNNQQNIMVNKQQSNPNTQTTTNNALKPQKIYIIKQKIYGKIHLIQGLSNPEIKDIQFKHNKKLIQKYRRKKYIIFIIFSQQDKKQLQKNHQQLVQFGILRNVDNIIYYDHTYTQNRLFYQILSKYENSFKYDLVTNYRMMKDQKKQVQKLSKRYIQWKKVINKQIDPLTFALMNFRLYTDSMRSSFTGTYSNSSHYQLLGIVKSINWKIMQLLHQFWQTQSDILYKQVDSFPLSYIQQQYKMSDHYSIGGFLPDTCFKSIFSPPLYQFKNSLISTIENIKQLILHHIQKALNYTFQHTNIQEQFIEKQLQNIENISNKFISQITNSLTSQIQFIHANPQDFWNYRQLNSSFYSPDQQVYIEIKYIGKAYVRKVHQSIKDTVPRLIGQALLKKIEKYLAQDSINSFIQVTKDKQFQIVINPRQKQSYEKNLEMLKQLDNLVAFFSLKVNASFLIKNFHEKKQKEWDRMFGRSQNIVKKERDFQAIQRGGILKWMKNLFKKEKNTRVRANTVQKKIQKNEQAQQKILKPKEDNKNLILNQKNWLLIINTGRQVSYQRIKMSALQGFPYKFRSSIWMYLSTNGKPKGQKLKTILTQTPHKQIANQIQKDLPRTSPRQLFNYSMKSSLRNVLLGYSLYDKQVGYTQGMNFITAVILSTLINYGDKTNPLVDNRINHQQIQQKAFCILKHIMQNCGVKKLMMIQPALLADIALRLTDRIAQLTPKMIQLINKTPFSCQMIFSSPIISCLSNVTTNIPLMRRFLDILITHDFLIVYQIIAKFVAHTQFFINKLNQENLYDFLKNKMYDEVYGVIGDSGLSKMFRSL